MEQQPEMKPDEDEHRPEDEQLMEQPQSYYYSYYRRRGYYYSYYRRRGYYYNSYYSDYSTNYRRRYYNAEVEQAEEPGQLSELAEEQATDDANNILTTVAVCGLLVGTVFAVAFMVKRRRATASAGEFSLLEGAN